MANKSTELDISHFSKEYWLDKLSWLVLIPSNFSLISILFLSNVDDFEPLRTSSTIIELFT